MAKLLSGEVCMNRNRQNKFEIVSCPHDCMNCKLILFDINRLYHESEQYQINKEYQSSVSSLKKAFEKTLEFSEPVEQECADLFRQTIIESLEAIHQELKRMTSGLFRKAIYKRGYIMAEETLQEFKKNQSVVDERKIQNSSIHSKDLELNLPAV